MKKVNKIKAIIYIFIFMQLVTMILANVVRADFIANIVDQSKKFENTASSGTGVNSSEVIAPLLNIFVSVRIIGFVIATAVIAITLIQLTSKNSENSAKAKEILVPRLLLAAGIILASTIFSILIDVFTNIQSA